MPNYTTTGYVYVPSYGGAPLRVANSSQSGYLYLYAGTYSVRDIYVSGFSGDQSGEIVITNSGTVLTAQGDPDYGGYGAIYIGDGSGTYGTVTVQNGAELQALGPYNLPAYDDSFISVGIYGGTGLLTVTGDGSRVTIGSGGYLVAGAYAGTGDVVISDGGLLTTPGAGFGYYGGTGALTITGAGSRLVAGGYGDYFLDPYDANLGGRVIFGGAGGTGSLYIYSGGLLSAVADSTQGTPTYGAGVIFGNYAGSKGYGVVDGAGAEIRVEQIGASPYERGGVAIGYNGGVGSVAVSNGGVINVSGEQGAVLVGQSDYDYEVSAYIPPASQSVLSLDSGAQLLVDSGAYGGANVTLGENALSDGRLLVSGGGTGVTVTSSNTDQGDGFTGSLVVGDVGHGVLQVYDNAMVDARALRVGLNATFFNGSYFHDVYDDTTRGQYAVATYSYAGDGEVTISGGAQVTLTASPGAPYSGVLAAYQVGTQASITVTGSGSLLTSQGGAGRVQIGRYGYGVLNVLDDAEVEGFSFDIGRGYGGTGTIYVDGVGSRITASNEFGAFETDPGEAGFFRLGRDAGSYGYLSVTGGGRVDVINDPATNYDNPVFQLARNNGAQGAALISGYTNQGGQYYYSTLNVTQTGPVGEPFQNGGIGPYGPRLVVGSGGQGVMTVENKAQVNVTGANARLLVAGGRDGDNTVNTSILTIKSGADVLVDGLTYGGNAKFTYGQTTVYSNLGPQVRIGDDTDAYGLISVYGAGSTLAVTSSSTVAEDYANSQVVVGANGGNGYLNVSDSGAVYARGLRVGEGAGSFGVVSIDSGGLVEVTSPDGTPYQGVRIGAGGGQGVVTVSGDGSVLTSQGGVGRIQIGADGAPSSNGSLIISSGGLAQAHAIDAGREVGSYGDIAVSGLGSTLLVSDEFGDFQGVYSGQGGLLRLGRNGGSAGSLFADMGASVIVRNDPNGDFDNPKFEMARNNGSLGLATITGYDYDSQAGKYVYTSLLVTQTGPVGEPYARGQSAPFGPRVVVGSGGEAHLDVTNKAQIEVSGANARLVVAAGRRDQYGNPDTTPYQSSLLIDSGADVLVDSGAYGGKQDTYNPYTQQTITTYLGAQVRVGDDDGANGLLRVSGYGSTLTVASTSNVAEDYSTGNLVIGANNGNGWLQVSNYGAVYARSLRVGSNFGNGVGAYGSADVYDGGYVLIEGQAGTPYQGIRIGEAGGTGIMTVSGYASQYSTVISRGADGLSPGTIRVGSGGDGALVLQYGGRVYASFVQVGRATDGLDGDGQITIDGSGGYNSRLLVSDAYGQFVATPGFGGFVSIGRDAGSYGRISVLEGGDLSVVTDYALNQSDAAIVSVGDYVGATGVLDVSSTNAQSPATVNITTFGQTNNNISPGTYYGPLLRLGRYGGEGIVNIGDNGVVNVIGESAEVAVGLGEGVSAPANSDLSVLTISGSGVLNVDSRDQVQGANYQEAAVVSVGSEQGGYGNLVVTGASAALNVFSDNFDDVTTDPDALFDGIAMGAGLVVAEQGWGSLLVDDGAQVNIDGADDAFPFFAVGYGDDTYYNAAYGYATVTNGGRITITGANTGVNASYNVGTAGLILIGGNYRAHGSLAITAGGAVYNADASSTAIIGALPGSYGDVLVTGAGSYFDAGARLGVGARVLFANGGFASYGSGYGTLAIEDSGVVSADFASIGRQGVVTIDGGTLDSIITVSGVLAPGQVDGIGSGTLDGSATVGQFGSIDFEIDGFLQTQADFLTLTGTLSVTTGVINVDLGGLAQAQIGDEIAFLQAAQIDQLDIGSGVNIFGAAAPANAGFFVEQRTVLVGQENVQQLFLVVDEVFDNRVTVVDPAADVAEGDPGEDVSLAFDVTRSGDLNQTLTIDWAVTGTGANPADAADFAGGTLPSGQFTFGVGEDTGTILVPLSEDFDIEPDEGVRLTISSPTLSGGDPVTVDNATSDALILNEDFAPVAVDDPDGGGAFQTGENTPLIIATTTLEANDFDPDAGQNFVVNGINPPVRQAQSANGVAMAFNGVQITYGVGLDTSTSFDFLAEGEIFDDSFTYDLVDTSGALSNAATVFVQIVGVNDAPVAVAGSAATNVDTALNGQLVATDVDNDLADLVFSVNGAGAPANGSVSITSDGGFTYTPDLGFIGTDTFDFDVSDGLATVTETFTVSVSDVLVAVDDALSVTEQNPGVMVPGGFTLNTGNGHFYQFVPTPVPFLTASSLAMAFGGHLATITSAAENAFVDSLVPGDAWIGGTDLSTEGLWVWQDGPEQGDVFWVGKSGGFTPSYANWTAGEPNDAAGNEDAAHIATNGMWNDLPIGVPLGYVVEISNPGSPAVLATGSVAANDNIPGNAASATFTLDSPIAGLTLFSNGDYEFDSSDPAYDFLSVGQTTDVLAAYTVTDEFGAMAGATLTITIAGVNDAPVARNDELEINESGVLNGDVFADNGNGVDSDPDSLDSFVVSAVNGFTVNVGQQFTLPSGALVTVQSDGTFSYDTNGAFDLAEEEQVFDVFNYTISDGNGGFDDASVILTVKGDPDFTLFNGTAQQDIIAANTTDGPDSIDAGSGKDYLSGKGGDDIILGGDDADVLRGGQGADSMDGGAGADKMFGEQGDDTMRGGSENDQMRGGDGLDQLFGDAGNDRLSGGDGADLLDGGTGADTLSGGAGDDTLTGDIGADQFEFSIGDGSDTITDFEQGVDRIAVFSGADTFADLAISGVGTDVQISFADVTITLLDQQPGDFTAADFIF